MSCCGDQPQKHHGPPPTDKPCCASRWTDDRLIGLPTRGRFKILGTDGKEMVQFPPAAPTVEGDRYLVLDQWGNAYPSTQPRVPIPVLRNVQVEEGQPVQQGGDFVEDPPPPFHDLLVTIQGGLQYRIHGQKGQIQRLQWDGCKFVFVADNSDLTLDNLQYVGPTRGYCNVYEAVWVKLDDGTIAMGYRSKPSMPPGTILMWGGQKTTLPAGWIVCEGQQLSTTAYPDLFTAWGYGWGGSGSTFRAPDARGGYPRAVDDGAGVNPNAAARTAKYSGGNIGDRVGSYGNGTNSTSVPYDFGVFFIAFAGCIVTS